MQHNKFVYQNRNCRTANATPLNIIGHIELSIQTKHITTFVIAHVATNLITPILLGNDWIDTNHVHLFGDEKHLTIPDQHGQLTRILYTNPRCINYPALLLNEITLSPHSQTLVDITSQINNANNLVFEPNGNHHLKFIFIPHTLLNIHDNKAKVLMINAENRQQTLSKNTRIGTISRDATLSIYATTNQLETDFLADSNWKCSSKSPQHSKKTRAVSINKKQLESIRIRCLLSSM